MIMGPKKVSIMFCLFMCMSLLVLIGCNTGNTSSHVSPPPTGSASRPWILVWSPPSANVQHSNSPAEVFAACAQARRPNGTLSKPASTVWLATSSNFALVLVHLDPAERDVAVGMMGIDPLKHQWRIKQAFSISRPPSGNGISAAQQDRGWTLPAGNYRSAESNIASTTPQGEVRLWLSDTQQELVLAHVYSPVKRPSTKTTSVVLNGRHGWAVTQQGITEIVVGMAQGTLIFAGTTSRSQSQHMVTQALTHPDTLLIPT
jgi:hypothetical protein